MGKSNFFADPIAGLFIKIAVALNSIAIAIIAVSPAEENLPFVPNWPWLMISTPIVIFLLWRHYKAFNAQTDRQVSIALSGGNIKPVLLYLRPFVTDGYLIDGGNSFTIHVKGLLQFVDTTNVFEGRLLSVVCKKYVPVKFDESEENESKKLIYKIRTMFSYRFGRHFDDTDDWLNTVDRTLNNCALCIIVPPAVPGSSTWEEIEMAFERSITGKLVFIMPGKYSGFKTNEGIKITAKQLWENLLQMTKDKIQLPGYTRNGGFVLPVNGRMTLIDSCHGFDWFHKKAMKEIFLTGKLTCPKWLGSLKVTCKLVWQFLPLSVLYTAISLSIIFPDLSETERYGPAIIVVFFTILLLHMRAFYRFCSRFLLTQSQVIGLFISTIAALITGLIAALNLILNWGISLIDTLELSWIETPEVGSIDFSPSYTLYVLFLQMFVATAFVYLTAFLFFRGQQQLEFKVVPQAD